MNKFLLAVLFFSLVVSSFAQTNFYGRSRAFKLPAGTSATDYLPGVVIVKFKETPAAPASVVSSGTGRLKKLSVRNIVQKFPGAGSSTKDRSAVTKAADRAGLNRIFELRYSGNDRVEDVVNDLLKDKNIEYAEPAYIAHISYIPSDPYYAARQSYLAQVMAPQAWNLTHTAGGVVIGIVDSGSELNHEDLAGNIAGGWDLIGADNANFSEDDNPGVVNAANDHGVHVSGLASAVSNNNRGIASIASDAKLLIVKVAADNQPNIIYKGYDGIKYAADHGANVINCSWGSKDRSLYGEDIINYAISKGCLVIAAAGNNNSDVPDYPAGYKGVLAVANVLSDDIKSPSSNYGSFVSIAAPGENIFSTLFNNSYGEKSGTSMASPIVSSAAALLKSFHPELSMQQVGEQLRVTADNTDAKNPAFANRLGKGRLNIYRALTESYPSIRYQNVYAEDESDNRLLPGTTVNFYLDLKNFLAPVSDLRITLKSNSPYATVTSGSQTITGLATLEDKTRVGPFSVYIEPGTPGNAPVEFTVSYSGNNNSYTDYEAFTQVVALDYMNIRTASLATSVTSNGRIGFSSFGQIAGLGFQYKGSQLLYEASLMIGNSTSSVSNNTRRGNGEADEHFVKNYVVKEVSTDSTVSGVSEFDDSGNSRPLNIDVRHSLTASKNSKKDKYVIAEYEVINRNNTALRDVYIGTFNDWDIADAASNATDFNTSENTAYAYSTGRTPAPYAGVKLLSSSAPPLYYPMSLSRSPLNDDNFTIEEKFKALSSGVASSGIYGSDVSFVTGYGPYVIPAHGSVKIAFAYGGGDDIDDLKKNLASAQAQYDQQTQSLFSASVLYTYPNPVTPQHNSDVTAVINLPEAATVTLDLYNLSGQKVRTLMGSLAMQKGTHTLYYNLADISSGIYLLRMRYNNTVKTHKISVIR